MMNAMEQSKNKMNARILLVDDEPEFCRNINHYFQCRSEVSDDPYVFCMETENESSKALERIREFKPHVVILDQFFRNQKESGYDVFWKIVQEFKEQIRQKKLGIIYYTKKDEFEWSAIWEAEFIGRGLENKIHSILRMRCEYQSPQLLATDVLGLLNEIAKPIQDDLYLGPCERCGILFQFHRSSVFYGSGDYSKPLFGKSKTHRNIMLFLGSPPNTWRNIREIAEHCWVTQYPTKEAVEKGLQRFKKSLVNEIGSDAFSNYFEADGDQYKMRKSFECICDSRKK